MTPASSAVVVVGSLNVDHIASVPHLPKAGETVAATKLIRRFGGKGANQAIAAARQGVTVSMIGCAGADADGRAYRKRLAAEGIDARGIYMTSDADTGAAFIAVDRQAENTIVVASGANGQLGRDLVQTRHKLITAAKILLLQQEVQMEAVIESIQIAHRVGVEVIFNPSPKVDGFPWGKLPVGTVIANDGEAGGLFGLRGKYPARPRQILAKYKINRLLITRGKKSTICLDATGCREVPTLRVQALDTVGAGDTFAGVLAARLAEGVETFAAIRYANCAAALATLLPGAQESIPNRRQTEKAFRTGF